MVTDVREGRRETGFGRRFPVFYALTWPFRRLFGSRRAVLTLLAVLLGVTAVPAVWWSAQLAGLPDVGEPFDPKAFRAETIPDERNAFVLYRKAVARYRPLAGKDQAVSRPSDFDTRWAKAPPDVRAWLDANRGALEVFREGTGRPDALDPTQLTPTDGYVAQEALRPFLRLGLLEASRRESLGDMDGAREWYRSLLRATHHLGLRARVYRRRETQWWHQQFRTAWASWAADPRTTSDQLRRAADDVNACAALEPSEIYTVKSEYLYTSPFLGPGGRPSSGPPPRWLGALHYYSKFGTDAPLLTTDHLRSLTRAWRAWRREPERSLRVFRLVTANRLAFEALDPSRRPKPDPSVALCEVYRLGPDAPAAARALAPEALGRWLDSCADAPFLIHMSVGNRFRALDLANRQALLSTLTSELARREPAPAP